eukprot:2593613-Pyramimonas_sp.AAC.1
MAVSCREFARLAWCSQFCGACCNSGASYSASARSLKRLPRRRGYSPSSGCPGSCHMGWRGFWG